MFLGGELKPFRVTKSGSNTYARLGLNFDLITSFENGSEMKTIESKSTISIKALEPKTDNTVRNIQENNLLWVYDSLIFLPKILFFVKLHNIYNLGHYGTSKTISS